ncbi:sensor domain-containing protein [Labrys wisconsinensis]|uniref:Diguanylate cyclase (GGDEF)-like protein/PAS domain S-box-containing protein n=1 Tax=Labrys wisconsinensis TaxID=425677 RepID=A0ABU0JL74_9HYPH|nr:EAL domain-containing protein [Labrys wisconsinensis]MDQ0475045.1 diguanylate cyclase (GGDEF)-like protein/PAS domain S-box-containing protein [Labrys wisconsinensis]
MIAGLTSDAVFVTDADGRIAWVNPGFERVTGWLSAQAIGRVPEALLALEGAAPAAVELIAAIRGGRPIRREICGRARDGGPRWLDITVRPLPREDGSRGVIAVASEITALKTMAAELRRQNEDLEQMSRLTRLGSWSLDLASGSATWSDEVRRIHAVDAGFHPTWDAMLAFHPPAARERICACLAAAAADGKPWDIEIPFTTAAGTARWIRMIGAPAGDGGTVDRIVGTIQDVTEAVAAREDVTATTERLALATESAHIGLWDWSVLGDRFWTSPQWWTYLGFAAPQEAICDDLADQVIHPDDLPGVQANRKAFFAERKAQLINEFRHRDGTGGWRWIVSIGRVTHRAADGTAERVSGVYIDIEERKAAAEMIAHAARHDVLTGLANRSEMKRRLGAAFERCAVSGEAFAVLVLDLDRFKAINDTFGHATGDAVLTSVADRILSTLGEAGMVARLGGDEFAILLESAGEGSAPETLAGRLLETIGRPYPIDGRMLHVGVSIGIAVAPVHGADADTLIRNADTALYKVKAEGKNAFRIFDAALEAESQERRELEADLREAIARNQLELHYQTIASLTDRRVAGAEALLRWRHPRRGFVSPDLFIPIAEESGLIVPIGAWAIARACRDAASWPVDIPVSVNVSTAQLDRGDLFAVVMENLKTSGLPARRLELEVTETIFLRDDEALLSDLRRLHGHGVRLALDDFGTGYSALGYLRRLPFDKIKIDRSFIGPIGTDTQAAAVVCAVANLARSLDIETTAEGIETEAQAMLVAAAGCNLGQGFLFSSPVPHRNLDFRSLPGDLPTPAASRAHLPPARQPAGRTRRDQPRRTGRLSPAAPGRPG